MRLFRITLICILVLSGIATAAHFYIQANARKLLTAFVHDESNGTLAFHAKDVSIDYWNKKVTFKGIAFRSTDLNKGSSSYAATCPLLIVELKALLPLLESKKFQIKKILVEAPKIVIYKKQTESSKVRVAKEWGEVYKGIQHTLSQLYLETFRIDNANITIIPEPSSGDKPIVIGQTYLQIDQFLADNHRAKKPEIQAKKISLTMHNQHIFFPNKGHYLRFKKLHIDTENELVFIEHYALVKPIQDTQTYYRMEADTLLISRLDFEQFYESGDLHAGKISLGRPNIEVHIRVKERVQRTPKKSLKLLMASIFNEMKVDTLEMRSADAYITTQQGKKINELKVDDVYFYTDKLRSQLSDAQGEPVSFGKIHLNIRDYTSMLGDSSYQLAIGNIEFDNQTFRFQDIELHPVHQNRNKESSITLKAMEFDNLSINDLLFHKRLVADRLLLDEPSIDLASMGKKAKPATGKKKKNISVQELLDSVFQVKLLQIRNGDIAVESKKGYHARANSLSLDAEINNTINISDPDAIVNQIKRLTFRDLDIKTKAVSIRVDGTQMRQNEVEFGKLQFATADGKISGVLYQVRTAPSLGELDENQLQVQGLSWQKGDVYLNIEDEKTESAPDAKPNSLDILLKKLSANQTQFHLKHPVWKAKATMETLRVDQISLQSQKKPMIEGAQFRLKEMEAGNGPLQLQIGSWQLTTASKHSIQGIIVSLLQHDTLKATIPTLEFSAALKDILDKKINLSGLSSSKPDIYFAQNPIKASTPPAKKTAPLDISSVSGNFKDLTLHMILRDSVSTRKLEGKKVQLQWQQMLKSENGIDAKGLVLESPDMRFAQNEQLIWNGKFATTLTSLSQHPQTLRAEIQQVYATGDQSPDFQLNENKGSVIRFDDASLGPVIIEKKGKIKLADLLRTNRSASLKITNLDFENNQILLKAGQIQSPALQESLTVKQFVFQPKDSPFVYMAKQAWQTDYIALKSQEIKIEKITVPDTGDIDLIRTAHIQVQQPEIFVYRDKMVPFKHNQYKALPTAALQQVKQAFQIDSISVRGGSLQYQEKSDKTELIGSVTIEKMQAKLRNIKNIHITQTDSLQLSARGLFMGEAGLNVRLRQSYLDTLHGFSFNANLGRFDLTNLNAMTEPAVSVKIKSGQLDTLYLRAIGRENLSLGTVHMPYNNLKVQFLKKGDESRKNLLSGLITFAANSFVIKKKNVNRTGVIYFPRNKEKSIFNYMVKMTLSGAASSAGAKSNKKNLKQYQKELKKTHLPPIPEEILE